MRKLTPRNIMNPAAKELAKNNQMQNLQRIFQRKTSQTISII